MGLLEESSYTEDLLKSTLYISNAGSKDVGLYSCSQVTSDLVDIDNDPDQSLHVFVMGSSLTPQDTTQVLLLPPSRSQFGSSHSAFELGRCAPPVNAEMLAAVVSATIEEASNS